MQTAADVTHLQTDTHINTQFSQKIRTYNTNHIHHYQQFTMMLTVSIVTETMAVQCP